MCEETTAHIACIRTSIGVWLLVQGMEGGAHQLLYRPLHEATRLSFLLKCSLRCSTPLGLSCALCTRCMFYW